MGEGQWKVPGVGRPGVGKPRLGVPPELPGLCGLSKEGGFAPGTCVVLGIALQTQNFRILSYVTKIKMTMLLGRYLVF